ncbi:MAG: hypothetical protein R2681_02925 [Pyrinomonadaceae bacterium]
MKNVLSMFCASVCLILGLTVYGSAQTSNGRIVKRQKIQQKRIFNGVQNGSVTGGEFRRLENQQHRTRRLIRGSRSDGEVTNRERFAIRKRQNVNSRTIFRAKHNNRNQPETPIP